MKIIVDTREGKQTYLEFPYEYVTETVREKLAVGDYQAEFENGYRPPVIFERKAIGDLFSTMGKGYDRFKREMMLAKDLGIKLIIIVEKPIGMVFKGYKRSQLSGESIVRKLFTLYIKYDILPVFCRNQEECSRYIYEFYCSIGRLLKKTKKPILPSPS